MTSGPSRGGALGLGLTQTTAPTLEVKMEPKPEEGLKAESDEEIYSEPDEGVEIVDMNDIRKIDRMAPDTLKRESEYKKKVKSKKRAERPPEERGVSGKGEGSFTDFTSARV